MEIPWSFVASFFPKHKVHTAAYDMCKKGNIHKWEDDCYFHSTHFLLTDYLNRFFLDFLLKDDYVDSSNTHRFDYKIHHSDTILVSI